MISSTRSSPLVSRNGISSSQDFDHLPAVRERARHIQSNSLSLCVESDIQEDLARLEFERLERGIHRVSITQHLRTIKTHRAVDMHHWYFVERRGRAFCANSCPGLPRKAISTVAPGTLQKVIASVQLHYHEENVESSWWSLLDQRLGELRKLIPLSRFITGIPGYDSVQYS